MIIRFGNVVVDRGAYTLRVDGALCHVEPLVFDLIVFLAGSSGRVISRDEIIEQVWGGRIVSDATISSCIKSARQALGDSGAEQSLIRTVRGRGFKFIANVTTSGDEPHVAAMPARDIAPAPLIPSELPAQGAPSIAVLPLQLLTPNERHDRLGDAVSQEVILELSRLHWLFVIARGSSFMFRDPNVDLRSVSETLGVRYVLTGTLSIHGQTSVVAVELVQGSDGRVIWAQRFEQPLSELLLLKSTIAANIVGAVETRIQTTEAIHAGRLPTENLDAWSAYHRGLWHMFRYNEADNAAAADLFARAAAEDPYFARAHAGLSFTHFQKAFLNFSTDREEDRRLTRMYAERSFELDPLDPFVNLTMGRSDWLAGDLEAAMPWLKRSIDLSPNYAFAIYNHALLGVLQGDGEQGEQRVKRAISLSPVDPLSYAMLGTRSMSHMLRGDYDTAADWAARAIRAPHAHFQIFALAAIAYEMIGERDLAEQTLARIQRMKPDFRQSDFFRAFQFTDGEFRAEITKAMSNLNIS